MSRLTARERHDLPPEDFAGPDGSYPVPDKSHARFAIAMVDKHGTAALKKRVKAKVHKKFPGIHIGKMDGGAVCHRMDRPSRKKH